jgi:hypothetical protein
MAKTTGLAPEQLRALDRLTELPGIERFYLAGASGIAWHLNHRRSFDLDLFTRSPRTSIGKMEEMSARRAGIQLVSSTDVMVALKVGSVPVDLVRYPYPLLEDPIPGPRGFPVAQRLDLAAMKLAAIARRGIKRDFWDLYELAGSGITLPDAARAYARRFGRAHSDLYFVQRALVWFADAEADPVPVRGLSPTLWNRIKAYFLKESPRLLEGFNTKD